MSSSDWVDSDDDAIYAPRPPDFTPTRVRFPDGTVRKIRKPGSKHKPIPVFDLKTGRLIRMVYRHAGGKPLNVFAFDSA